MSDSVQNKLEKAREVFQRFSEFAMERGEMKVILAYLENTNPEYRSIAYESVAMAIASKDLASNNLLNGWRAFMEGPAIGHIQQVHVGLGWAMAKADTPVAELSSIEYLMRPRVIDGRGYYDGLFKARSVIKGKKLPEGLNEVTRVWYDQGLGRSTWFLSKGDPAQTKEMISSFPEERQAALWKGIGHAASYIGGCDTKVLNDLAQAAGKHRSQLAVGAAMAARGRVHANHITADTELACRTWWKLSAKDVNRLTDELLPLSIAEDIYDLWQKALESKFTEKELIRQ